MRQPRPTLFPYTTLFRSLARTLKFPRTAPITQPDDRDWAVGCSQGGNEKYFQITLKFRIPGPLKKTNVVLDRKSTRLNSSHMSISYAVFCLKKKNRRYYH